MALYTNALSNAVITSEDSVLSTEGTTFFPLSLAAVSQADDFSLIPVTTQELSPDVSFVL